MFMIMLDKEVMKTLNNVYYYIYVKVTLSLYMVNIFLKNWRSYNKKTPNELTAVLNSHAWRSGLVKSLAMRDHDSSLVHIILLPIDLVKRKLRQIIATIHVKVLFPRIHDERDEMHRVKVPDPFPFPA